MKKAIITGGHWRGYTGTKIGTRDNGYGEVYYVIQLDDDFRECPLYVAESRIKFLDTNNTND